MVDPEVILGFWFPPGHDADEAALLRQLEWWFRGGADADILARFVPALEAAARGEHDDWTATPRGRLALILVLDQFSRSAYRNEPRTYAQDEKAIVLSVAGLDAGEHGRLATIWEKTFFVMPLVHSERIELHDRAGPIIEALVDEAPPHQRKLAEFSVSQARGHRDVVARFGRHPHRNAVLGRASTPDELAHLAAGQPVHKRTIPT